MTALTPREHDIIASLCKGFCNKRIARDLGISLGTVKIHLHNIYEKLGISSRAELLLHALAGPAPDGKAAVLHPASIRGQHDFDLQ